MIGPSQCFFRSARSSQPWLKNRRVEGSANVSAGLPRGVSNGSGASTHQYLPYCWKDCACPLSSGGVQVFLDLNPMLMPVSEVASASLEFGMSAHLRFELGAEYGIGEADGDTNVVRPKEGVVSEHYISSFRDDERSNLRYLPIIHITRTPSKNVRIESHYKGRESRFLRPRQD